MESTETEEMQYINLYNLEEMIPQVKQVPSLCPPWLLEDNEQPESYLIKET